VVDRSEYEKGLSESRKKNIMILLDRNEHNYGPAPVVFDILKSIEKDLLGFYSREFDKGIKSSLSRYIGEVFEIPENRVLLGYGGEDLLKQVVHCYLSNDNNNTLLIPSHSWWYYRQIADEVGGKTFEYPLYEAEDSFKYDIEGMKKSIDENNPKILFIASPNNPTGNSMSYNDLCTILDYVGKDCVVVIDEAYAMYRSTDVSYLKELLDNYPNLVIIRTFSKYYGLPALRIGFALVGENLNDFIGLSTRYLGFNRISEEIGIAVLQEEKYYQEISRKMCEDKEMFKKELNVLDGWKVFDSDANFIFVKIPVDIKEGLKKFLVERKMIIKFMNEELLNCHLRVTLGTQEQNRLLVDLIKEYYEQR